MQDKRQDETLVVLVTDGAEAHDAGAQLKVGWRRQADTTGACPVCGATLRQANRAERRELARRYGAGFGHVVMEHAPECPVGDGPLRRAS